MDRRRKQTIDHYYERNTHRFLRFAARGSSSTIHRAIWAPGISKRLDAVHYVHTLILQHAPVERQRPVSWDLGCGVGASIAYLAQHRPGCYRGVTISRTQKGIAERFLSRSLPGKMSNWGLLHADFCAASTFETLLAQSPDKPSLVYMIEAFGHANDPQTLIRRIADCLLPGGHLVICDDIIAREEYRRNPEAQAFAAGWRIETLWTVEEISACSAAHGLALIRNLDLSPWVELNRPRDRVIRGLVSVMDRSGLLRRPFAASPFWGNLRGGDALQRALTIGTVRYRFLVYRKR